MGYCYLGVGVVDGSVDGSFVRSRRLVGCRSEGAAGVVGRQLEAEEGEAEELDVPRLNLGARPWNRSKEARG